jgi:hypothetical protein
MAKKWVCVSFEKSEVFDRVLVAPSEGARKKSEKQRFADTHTHTLNSSLHNMAEVPFLGCSITLISKADVRYQVILSHSVSLVLLWSPRGTVLMVLIRFVCFAGHSVQHRPRRGHRFAEEWYLFSLIHHIDMIMYTDHTVEQFVASARRIGGRLQSPFRPPRTCTVRSCFVAPTSRICK